MVAKRREPAERPDEDDSTSEAAEPIVEEVTEETSSQDETPEPGSTESDDGDPFDDDATDQAVDDIVHSESDELLTAEDNLRSNKPAVPVHRGFWHALGRPFAFWWLHKVLRWLTVLLVLGGIIAAGLTPTARYWALNQAGIQVKASVHVLDDTSGQPLKGVVVKIDGLSAQTGADGTARFGKLALGPHQLEISEPGFAVIKKHVVLGLGSNPLGDFELQAIGAQYTFQISDYITGHAVQGVEVSNESAAALSDKKGKAILTLPPGTEAGDITVTLARSGYRTETMTVKAFTETETPVRLVTNARTVFVSKQSGKYDVTSSYVDGQDKKVLLAGTGSENGNITLVTSPDGTRAALVSKRDGQQSTLSLITIDDATTTIVAQAEHVRLIDWVGTRLVFELAAADSKTAATKYSIVSFDYSDSTRLQLASSARFSTAFGAQGSIYYGIPSSADDPSVEAAFYRINPDSTGKQTVLDTEVWSSYRTGYSTLGLQTPDGLYQYDIGTGKIGQINTLGTLTSRGYVDNPKTKQSVWVYTNGSQAVLQRYDPATGKGVDILTQAGLTYPVRWLGDNAVIYRVVTSTEVADYVVSAEGSQPAYKIGDVVNTFGLSLSQ